MNRYDAKATPAHFVHSDDLSPLGDLAWFAVHTKSACERLVYDALLRKGFKAYLPMNTRVIRHARQSQVVSRPLFPRYLFVGLNAERPVFGEVRKTHGVEWFVTNATKPVEVRAEVIAALRASEEGGLFDETRPKPSARIDMAPGDRVTMLEGPFANIAATILTAPSERRIEVLMKLFGRSTKITTTLANLRRVS